MLCDHACTFMCAHVLVCVCVCVVVCSTCEYNDCVFYAFGFICFICFVLFLFCFFFRLVSFIDEIRWSDVLERVCKSLPSRAPDISGIFGKGVYTHTVAEREIRVSYGRCHMISSGNTKFTANRVLSQHVDIWTGKEK